MERTTWKARNCIDPFLILPLFMIAALPVFIVYRRKHTTYLLGKQSKTN